MHLCIGAVRLCVLLSVEWRCTSGCRRGKAVVVKFMTVEDSVDVFSVRDELLRSED